MEKKASAKKASAKKIPLRQKPGNEEDFDPQVDAVDHVSVISGAVLEVSSREQILNGFTAYRNELKHNGDLDQDKARKLDDLRRKVEYFLA